MSHAKPQPDFKFLEDYLHRIGKKNINNQEFNKRKLENIASRIKNDDWVRGEMARANIEIYFNNYENAEQIFENLLKVTNNRSPDVWDLYISFMVMSGEISKLVNLMRRVVSLSLPQPKQLQTNFLHAVKVYRLLDVFEASMQDANDEMKNDYEKIKNEVDKISNLNVSIQTFRIFISQIYLEFYKNFNGTLSPKVAIEDNEIVVRAGCTINNAQDLFEINNLYRNKIMDIYANSTHEIQAEFDKITVYFKHHDFSSEFQGMHG